MKILQTCIRYPPATGGAEEYVRYTSEEVVNGVTVIRCRALHTKKFPYPIAPGMVQKLFSLKYDVLYAHGLYYFSLDAAVMAAKVRRKPVVLKPWIFDIDTKILGIPL